MPKNCCPFPIGFPTEKINLSAIDGSHCSRADRANLSRKFLRIFWGIGIWSRDKPNGNWARQTETKNVSRCGRSLRRSTLLQ